MPSIERADISNESGQGETIAFLKRPDSYPAPVAEVRVIETHAALVFLAGTEAHKIKKAVKYPYLDFSTLAKRQSACRRELEINQPHAPQIYLGIVPICRLSDGALRIGGGGEPVEWAVHMRRFDDDALLAKAVRLDDPGLPFFGRLADEIIRYHDAAPVIACNGGAARIEEIISELVEAFAPSVDVISCDELSAFARLMDRQAVIARHRLDQREQRGFVRRCHGDLHLGNIVVLDGAPVLFDAIEFDEAIATIDVLYDLAFLIMDLETSGLRRQANRVQNRYVIKSAQVANIAGLQAMPLFLACRAGIRAMVSLTRMRQATQDRARNAARDKALEYFKAALGFLKVEQPRLICIGGLSGTGKTTIARQLAPVFGRAPGALHLRSDVERKMVFGVGEFERLDASAYGPEVSSKIYSRLIRKCALALSAGSSVIVDAVFLNEDERSRAQRIADSCDASFTGLWLRAEEETMIERVTQRTDDASDATSAVVREQMSKPTGGTNWHRIDANGPAAATLESCLQQFMSKS